MRSLLGLRKKNCIFCNKTLQRWALIRCIVNFEFIKFCRVPILSTNLCEPPNVTYHISDYCFTDGENNDNNDNDDNADDDDADDNASDDSGSSWTSLSSGNNSSIIGDILFEL